MLCCSIISHETLVTYSKFGVSSTRAVRFKSGDMGSKAAEGPRSGILTTGRLSYSEILLPQWWRAFFGEAIAEFWNMVMPRLSACGIGLPHDGKVRPRVDQRRFTSRCHQNEQLCLPALRNEIEEK